MLKKILLGGRNMLNFLMDPETTINGGRPGGLVDPPIDTIRPWSIAPIFKEWRDWGIISPIAPINAIIKD